jgi:hypothetical protein
MMIIHRRLGCRWEDYIKMDLKEIAWEDENWIDLAEDVDLWQAVVNMVINFWFNEWRGIS